MTSTKNPPCPHEPDTTSPLWTSTRGRHEIHIALLNVKCNVKLRKLLSAHKSHIRETSLFTGAIPNPVRNSQTSHFFSVPGQNPERSSRGDSVVLRLE